MAPHHGHKSAFPDALFEHSGPPMLSVLSKGSEFGDKTDVDGRYSKLTTGMTVNVLSTNSLETKKVVTSRSNGLIYLDFTDSDGALICIT